MLNEQSAPLQLPLFCRFDADLWFENVGHCWDVYLIVPFMGPLPIPGPKRAEPPGVSV